MIALNPHVFAQYLEFARVFGSEQVLYPNLGGLLALISGRRALALAPSLAGLIWLILYFRRHQRDWDWKTAAPLLLLVSVTCSYYSYPYDEVLVLPALIAAAAGGNRRAFLAGFFLTNAGYAFYLTNSAGRVGFDYMFLCWTSSAWLLTYLASCGAARRTLSARGGA